jgi:hypothetical protein
VPQSPAGWVAAVGAGQPSVFAGVHDRTIVPFAFLVMLNALPVLDVTVTV